MTLGVAQTFGPYDNTATGLETLRLAVTAAFGTSADKWIPIMGAGNQQLIILKIHGT